MSVVFGYLLLSYGPKHEADVSKLLAAASQLRLLREISAKQGASLNLAGWDYARTIRGRNDLPQLFKMLEACRAQAVRIGGGPKIIMDDYSRLFRLTELGAKDELWRNLTDYSEHFRDLRHGKPLDALSLEMTLLIKYGALPPDRAGSKATSSHNGNGSAQTQKARVVSAVVRSKAADCAARELVCALQQHREQYPSATVKAFLASDKRSGLRNSQGRPWSYRSALRVLRGKSERDEAGDCPEGSRRGVGCRE